MKWTQDFALYAQLADGGVRVGARKRAGGVLGGGRRRGKRGGPLGMHGVGRGATVMDKPRGVRGEAGGKDGGSVGRSGKNEHSAPSPSWLCRAGGGRGHWYDARGAARSAQICCYAKGCAKRISNGHFGGSLGKGGNAGCGATRRSGCGLAEGPAQRPRRWGASHPLADDRHDGDAAPEGEEAEALHPPAARAQPGALREQRVDQLHQHHVDKDACGGGLKCGAGWVRCGR